MDQVVRIGQAQEGDAAMPIKPVVGASLEARWGVSAPPKVYDWWMRLEEATQPGEPWFGYLYKGDDLLGVDLDHDPVNVFLTMWGAIEPPRS